MVSEVPFTHFAAGFYDPKTYPSLLKFRVPTPLHLLSFQLIFSDSSFVSFDHNDSSVSGLTADSLQISPSCPHYKTLLCWLFSRLNENLDFCPGFEMHQPLSSFHSMPSTRHSLLLHQNPSCIPMSNRESSSYWLLTSIGEFIDKSGRAKRTQSRERPNMAGTQFTFKQRDHGKSHKVFSLGKTTLTGLFCRLHCI